MQTDDKVSIIIPSYNREDKIQRAIGSCFDQSYTNIEIVVVDDGSTDNSREVLNRIAATDSRLKVHFNASNRGANYCRNYGYANSTGTLVNFLDSDDVFTKHKVRSHVEEFRRNEDLQVVVSTTVVVEEATEREIRRSSERVRRDEPSTPQSMLELYASKKIAWLTHEPMWKRSFLDISGLFCETLSNSQEYEFHCRALSHYPKVAVLDECLSIVYLHDGVERINGPSRKRKDKIKLHFQSKILSRYIVATRLLQQKQFTPKIGKYIVRFTASILRRCYQISPSLGASMSTYAAKCMLDLLRSRRARP